MIRAWLIDDEKLALNRLSRMLRETGKVEVTGMSTDPREALDRLRDASVDALFLDIEMPGLNGFDLLRSIEQPPAVVFTTAYDQYAVRAFEANGTDYLLKPISPEALERAVARLERNLPPDPAKYVAMLDQLKAALGRQYPRRIASRIGDRVQFIELDKVTHFFADGKLTFAATEGKNYIVDDSIVQLESKLDPGQFQRIHRSYLVNLGAVVEVHSWFGGKMVARLNDAGRTELPVARDRVKGLKERLGF